MWRYKNCVCYDNDISKMMVMTYDNDEGDDYNGIWLCICGLLSHDMLTHYVMII